MQPFTQLTGVAAPLPLVNVDTDMIIPKQFLKTTTRAGLGQYVFHELRTSADGAMNQDFVLNRPPYHAAQILVTGANFGCGSSREHAPWALLDFGICCVIAPSFADIFHSNCFKNGILPVVLPQDHVDAVMAEAEAAHRVGVDLVAQTVTLQDGRAFSFTTDPFRRDCLLRGLDEIGLTEQYLGDIAAFEVKQRAAQPWLWP